MRYYCLLALGFVACGPTPDDTGPDIDALCAGKGTPSVVLGTGAGDEFNALSDGDTVGLDVAPQGGFGVSIRASTTGLHADSVVDLLLETELDGAVNGSHLSEDTQLFCQEDGSGLLWGAVVGFDSSEFKSNDDLLSLDGRSVDLVVTITDEDGISETGRVTVTIEI